MRERNVAWVIGAGCAALILMPDPASAHPGHGAQDAGFAAGLMHPLLGVDHVAAMVAVGLWAAQAGGGLLWRVPLAFVATMVVGGGVALASIEIPGVEAGIVASVVILGLLIAWSARLPQPLGLALVSLLALFHGAAHGAEMPAAAHPWLYGAGFVSATVFLHSVGLALGFAAMRLFRPGFAAVGLGIAALGVLLALG